MSKADKIERTIMDIAVIGTAAWAVAAFIGHCKKMARKENDD